MTDLAKEIETALREYTKEVHEELEKVKKDVATEAVQELRQTSPRKTGKYQRGWKKKKVGSAWIVYNTKYQLTHLLEKGHAKRGGGRVPAKVHIKPVEDKVIREAFARAERVLKR